MGGEIISFLYIIHHEKYMEHLNKEKFNCVLSFFVPVFKAKILEDLSIGENQNIKIAGVNIKKLNYYDENMLSKMIKKINKLKDENTKDIYIEGFSNNSLEIKDRIELETGLNFPKDNRSKIYNIKTILESLVIIKRSLREKEVLIICNDKDLILDIIKLLYNDFLFISIFEDLVQGEEICEDILKDIGLSIFIQKDINKTINKYGIIINMEKNIDINIDNIKKETIIFDFSGNFKFRNTKNKILIEDITIENKLVNNNLISNEITSSFIGKLDGDYRKSFYRIYSRGRYLTFDELINSKIQIKGSI